MSSDCADSGRQPNNYASVNYSTIISLLLLYSQIILQRRQRRMQEKDNEYRHKFSEETARVQASTTEK